MSPRAKGSAAGAMRRPTSAVRKSVTICVQQLGHAVELAGIAAAGPEPEVAARYIVDALDELRSELANLRAHLNRPR